MPRELRYNPLLNEWVIYSNDRENRPLFPRECPFCGIKDTPLSIENKYPSLGSEPVVSKHGKKAPGRCEVLIYSGDHNSRLAIMDLKDVTKVVELWKERYRELSTIYKTIYIFENRGEEIGITLNHPHGQIYAMNFYPPILLSERRRYREHMRKSERCFFCDMLEEEGEKNLRVIEKNEDFVSLIPYFARWSFETHIYPKEHVSDILCLNSASLASILRRSLRRLEGVGKSYVLCLHQFKKDFHFHIEIYPAYASKGRIKYRGGVETGAGTFINSMFPEESAKLLSGVEMVD